ncbi:glycoside hydrolase family 19 protein [Erythrobacter oryzae]|uniref:glycoside hydrolase family 19 protein n=1 Tax=Erythrobacter oryzae TaxID=3019556 RepID=UPI00255302A2|nr:glycoside hydrolase family 19 protein [Erythrobacter sp. COR-2]
MAGINRKFFFDFARLHLFGGSLTQKQVEGLLAILDYWESKHAGDDDRKLAYLLGTAYHETDKKMQPIHEYGSTAYFNRRYGPEGQNPGLARSLGNTQVGDGARYAGRGFVQLTGRRNYADWSTRLGQDLVGNPDLALDAAVATRILVEGSLLGTFTGRKLGRYFDGDLADWRNARRVINGLDRADLIAGHARSFYAAISYTV